MWVHRVINGVAFHAIVAATKEKTLIKVPLLAEPC